jgi:hypothetical protein
MRFYHSGTPRNDQYQHFEDSICDHRLFSLHGDYYKAVSKWVDALPPDRSVRKYPRTLLLDSGAFTAWNAGQPTTVEEVTRTYDSILKRVEGKFDEITCVNLDVIPGERGRTATSDEILAGFERSDINFEILIKRFGKRILPVFHQDEEVIAPHRLKIVCDQAEYICLSPRNDVHEASRHDWSIQMHQRVFAIDPKKRTHGLATTGNAMIRDVPWFSVDSAAWVLHGGMAGKVDFYDPMPDGTPRYRNFFVALEGGKQAMKDAHLINRADRDHFTKIIESYGFTYQEAETSGRIRSLICMGELSKFFDAARAAQTIRMARGQETWQDTLFDG